MITKPARAMRTEDAERVGMGVQKGHDLVRVDGMNGKMNS
jgi:hypothetical protein